MKYKVIILYDAEDDIFDIYRYIFINDSKDKAEYVLGKIEEACLDLENLPERGHIPKELDWVGVSNYREIHFKPYRIIYEIESKKVYIHCVLDGRRDLQQLLERRLLR
ncbi:MAG: type II toxin-antitoxin system RelE/ParE family toxin [Desulfobacterales bacterium]|nr:type II toxin-antitoxin system RelE/ParE family toxin [Desulfobacterales bacterium]